MVQEVLAFPVYLSYRDGLLSQAHHRHHRVLVYRVDLVAQLVRGHRPVLDPRGRPSRPPDHTRVSYILVCNRLWMRNIFVLQGNHYPEDTARSESTPLYIPCWEGL